ncbi:MAG TPA: cupin domain-containing protein [Opitutaceae bacterium]|nr:cupin domain-containing protein [Opitutaceae bacterium]
MHPCRSFLTSLAGVRVPGLRILILALPCRVPEHASIESHRHAWSQKILHLSGRGRQYFKDRVVQVEPGTLVEMPPGVAQAYQRAAGWLEWV